MEESYFRPFGLRTLSNQALYSADGPVVIYCRLGDPNIMKYVKNRADWLGRQDLMITSTLSDDEQIIQGREESSNNECSSEEPQLPYMRSCQTPRPGDPKSPRSRIAKVALADKEHFKSELTNCGFSTEGDKNTNGGKYVVPVFEIQSWKMIFI